MPCLDFFDNLVIQMILRFTSPLDQRPGIVAELLKLSYAELVSAEPEIWKQEEEGWEEFDREVFEEPNTIGACVFLSWFGDQLVGFGSYDPREGPELAIIGHNCVLPPFRRKGFGKQQIFEIFRLFEGMGIQKAKVSTNEHTFFIPARRMYVSCGFREIKRIPWDRYPRLNVIEYVRKIG